MCVCVCVLGLLSVEEPELGPSVLSTLSAQLSTDLASHSPQDHDHARLLLRTLGCLAAVNVAQPANVVGVLEQLVSTALNTAKSGGHSETHTHTRIHTHTCACLAHPVRAWMLLVVICAYACLLAHACVCVYVCVYTGTDPSGHTWQPWTDWLVYAAAAVLPWAGAELAAACPDELARVCDAVTEYLVRGHCAGHTPTHAYSIVASSHPT